MTLLVENNSLSWQGNEKEKGSSPCPAFFNKSSFTCLKGLFVKSKVRGNTNILKSYKVLQSAK